MAEFSQEELRAIEAVNVALQRAGFAAKLGEIQKPTISAYASDGAIAFANPSNIAELTKGSAGAYTLAALGAFVGATLDLIAINLKWHVVSKNVCTIAAV